MAWRPHSRASVNPDSPRAWSSCQRCGLNYNLENLVWQYQWGGANLINLNILVCTVTCLDKPSDFLKTIILPPDPPALFNVRPEPYATDETTFRITEDDNTRITEDDNTRVVQTTDDDNAY